MYACLLRRGLVKWQPIVTLPAPYASHSAKKLSSTASTKLRPISCSPVPLKVLESLVFNSIGSITTQPSDPFQFAYNAKRSTGNTDNANNAEMDQLHVGLRMEDVRLSGNYEELWLKASFDWRWSGDWPFRICALAAAKENGLGTDPVVAAACKSNIQCWLFNLQSLLSWPEVLAKQPKFS